jgi:hypothetical protein
MRSWLPIPDDPWPHDMTISVEDAPHVLLELLWIREAYGLRPAGADLPDLLLDTPERESAGDVEGWSSAWTEIWDAALRHAGTPREPEWWDDLAATADASPERAAALTRLIGPTWDERFGREALTERFSAWRERAAAAQVEAMPRSLAETPERRSLDALVPAWEAGLSIVVTIPVRGGRVQVVGPHALLIPASVRDDPAAYAPALRRFADEVLRT